MYSTENNLNDLLMEICKRVFEFYNKKESINDSEILEFNLYLEEINEQITKELNDKDILRSWKELIFYFKSIAVATEHNISYKKTIIEDGFEVSIRAAREIEKKLINCLNPEKRFLIVCEEINKLNPATDVESLNSQALYMRTLYEGLITIYKELSIKDSELKEDCRQIGLALDIYVDTSYETEHEKRERQLECLNIIRRIASKRLQHEALYQPNEGNKR